MFKILTILTIFCLISPYFIADISVSENINTSTEKYDLLIIAPSEFKDDLVPLLNHKIQHNIKTKIVTTEEVYQQVFWRGKDNAEKIKYFIFDAKEEWDISYVLLVGGRKDQSKIETYWVPVRYTHLFRHYEGHENMAEKQFLTDLYFADIYDSNGKFSSWDDDNDGIFGEWPLNASAEDIPDLYPDISVGRLPCRDKIDVKNVVNKIISYESGDFDDTWFKKMIVAAGDTYPYKTDYIDGENYTQQALNIMQDFEPVKIWSSLDNLHWTKIVKEINNGAGFVYFSGHGSAAGWVTVDANDPEKWVGRFRLMHMKYLNNKEMLPVIISGSGCFNNMFNVSLSHSFNVWWSFSIINSILSPIFSLLPSVNGLFMKYNIPRCWGWSLTSKPTGGGIAVIASTGYSYESCDIDSKRGGIEWLDIHFFEEYKHSNTKKLGDCWKNTINRFLQNFTINWSDNSSYGDAIIVKNVEQWLLFGDPSLKIGGYC